MSPSGTPGEAFAPVATDAPVPAGLDPHPRTALGVDVTAVWVEHGPWLVRYAERHLHGDHHAAEDVAQDAMLRLWRHPHALDEVVAVRKWLATVVRNIIIDRRRRISARPAEVLDMATPETVVDDDTLAVLDALTVHDVLSTVSLAHRAAVLEVYVRDHSMEEAARTLGVPVGTVKSRCHHALRLLRERTAVPTH